MRSSGRLGAPVRSFGRPMATLGLILLIVAIIGCGSSAPASTNLSSGSTDLAPAPAAKPAAAAPAAPAAAQAGAKTAPPANQAASQLPKTPDVLPLDRMVIRNATLSLQVDNVETALARVRDIADTYGGYVSNSRTSLTKENNQDRMVANITIAVRADAYDKAIANVRQVASKVESEDGTSQDVTDAYVDLDSNLRNLQASEDAILKLTEKATNLTDVLTLERELASVRGQIETIQGRKRLIEHQTSVSTIAISLHLPPLVDPTAPAEAGWNPLATFARGWHASLVALETLADGAITILSFFWWTIPVVGVVTYFYRRSRSARVSPVAPPPPVT